MHTSAGHIIKKIFRARNIIIVALLFFCVLAVVSLIHTTGLLWRNGGLHMRRGSAQGLNPTGPITPANIQPWMTFNYINVVFRLPADYLRTELKLTDPNYPRISIGRYAKRNKLNAEELFNSVKAAVDARIEY